MYFFTLHSFKILVDSGIELWGRVVGALAVAK